MKPSDLKNKTNKQTSKKQNKTKQNNNNNKLCASVTNVNVVITLVMIVLPCRSHRQGLVSYSFLLSFFFFLLLLSSFWQHVFFTYFPIFDFDQTWSKWPVPWPLLRHRKWWGQRSRWGHWGQKGHFQQKGIKSYRILSIDAWLMHMH